MAKLTQKKNKKSLKNAPKVPKNKEPVNEEKENLKKELSELKKLISRSEFVLKLSKCEKITKFCDVKLEGKPTKLKTKHKIKNWTYIFHHELDKLSGLYCTKSEDDEFIFNFDISSSGNDDSIYGVQIFTENDKESIGKQIMPTIDFVDSLLAETPLGGTKKTVPFLKNCRKHLTCFNDRKLQVQELKEATEDVKNINIDADMGFNMVIIHLSSVYDNIQGNFLNITVYFSYENNSARPQLINVDWSLKNKPTEESTKAMKSFVKIFKKLSLYEALLEIAQATHANFSWEPEKRENTSTIDLQAVSGSEEDSEPSVEVKKTKRKSKKIKRKRVESSQEELEEDLDGNSQHLNLTVDKSRAKKFKKSDSIKKIIKKPKKKDTKKPELRQSLLNFEKKPGPASKTKALVTNPPVESDNDTTETMKTSPKKKPAFTSTPMPQKNSSDNKFKKNPVVVIEMSPIPGDEKSTTNVTGNETKKLDDKKSKIPGPKSTKIIVNKSPTKKAVDKKTKIPVMKKKLKKKNK